jgi:hypothetical protein
MMTTIGRRLAAATVTAVSSPDRDFRLNRKPAPGSIVHYYLGSRSRMTMR